MAVVCAAAVPPNAVVWLVPYSSHCGAGEYCCHVVHCSLPGVWRAGGECVSVLFVWWGILCPFPPYVGGGGAVVDGGWHGEGRAAVLLIPRRMLVSPVCAWCPPFCCVVVPLNGGSGGCVLPPCSDWVFPFALLSPLLHCLAYPPILLFSLLSLSTVLCSLSQHCWFSAVSL